MNNADFWASIKAIIADGFTSEGLHNLDQYAELFINGRLVYKRFSPFEQHGCAAGGTTHVVASLLAGAETAADRDAAPDGNDFKREQQRGAQQAACIEHWARAVGCWTDSVDDSLPKILGEQIADYMRKMGFELRNPRNWTYSTPDIYLSDMHDENVLQSPSGTIFVVDCDIRINTPELRAGGTRTLTTEVELL